MKYLLVEHYNFLYDTGTSYFIFSFTFFSFFDMIARFWLCCFKCSRQYWCVVLFSVLPVVLPVAVSTIIAVFVPFFMASRAWSLIREYNQKYSMMAFKTTLVACWTSLVLDFSLSSSVLTSVCLFFVIFHFLKFLFLPFAGLLWRQVGLVFVVARGCRVMLVACKPFVLIFLSVWVIWDKVTAFA